MDRNPASGVTAQLCERARILRFEVLTQPAREVAKQCLLDWLGVAIATLVGRNARGNVRQATLVNGAMGHALDYDDATITMGHPTVPVAPVIMALGERDGYSGADLLTAFVAGVETEVAVSGFAGPSHYARGFHGTATYGCFGAAAAAAHLLRLDKSQFRHAMGIAGTQAAGLKAVFGTMCKPLHARNAATIGVLAADRAARGFTSNQDILEAPWGFGATQSDRTDTEAGLSRPEGGFDIPDTLFKYHAACYLTHATIEACLALRKTHALHTDDIKRVIVGVDPGHLSACGILQPTTGLQSKFSLVHTAALALSGEDSADDKTFSDAHAVRPDLVALRERITVVTRKTSSFLMSDVTIELAGGATIRAEADTSRPETDLDLQWRRLIEKFGAMTQSYLAPRIDEVVEICRSFEHQTDISALMRLVG